MTARHGPLVDPAEVPAWLRGLVAATDGLDATAWSRFTRSFEPDKKILQREAVGGSPLLERLAYAAVAVLAAIWLASLGWGLRRLDLDGRRAEAAPGPSTVESVLHRKSA